MDAATGSAIGGAAGGLFGIVSTAINAGAAKKQQDRQMQHDLDMAQQNYYYGEMAADAADARQRAQFNDMYSVQAQLKQLKEAGLSPSLMYGGTPTQGGATAPQGAGAQGAANNLGRYQVVDPMLASQIGLMTAQAMKATAEAKKAGADTSFTEAQTAWQELQNEIGSETKQTSIETINAQLAKINAATEQIREQTKGQITANAVAEATKEANIKKATEEATNLVSKRMLMEAQTDTERKKVRKMVAEIKQGYEALQIEWYKADVASMEADKQVEWYDKQIKQIDEKNHQFYETLDFNNEQLNWDKWKTGINIGTEVVKTAGTYLFFSGLNVSSAAPKIAEKATKAIIGAQVKHGKRAAHIEAQRHNNPHVE